MSRSANERSRQRLASGLVDWFLKNARDLPWRRTRDPYAIWVSEIMLQQTQVKTVIPYWDRWMERFPTIQTLAQAPEQAVLKQWEGLGYYRRARNLHKAAQILLEKNGGAFPNKFEEVLALPGVGRYTAGAVCSIALGQRTPILDGNVARVLSRLYLQADEKELWFRAEALVQAAPDPSALNQGLMELGATVCTPRDPECAKCPVAPKCQARKHRRIDEFPPAKVRAPARKRKFVAVVLRSGDRILARKREKEQVNGGLWEFPNFEATARPALLRQVRHFIGSDVELTHIATVRHTITNNRITLEAFAGSQAAPQIQGAPIGEWVAAGELETLPFSSAHARIRTILLGSLIGPDQPNAQRSRTVR